MMGWFSKFFPKPKSKHLCDHKWKELPWYIETSEHPYYSDVDVEIQYSYKLVSTYVCEKCGQISEKILTSGSTEWALDYNRVIESIKMHAEHRIKPKFMVEAEIQRIRRSTHE